MDRHTLQQTCEQGVTSVGGYLGLTVEDERSPKHLPKIICTGSFRLRGSETRIARVHVESGISAGDIDMLGSGTVPASDKPNVKRWILCVVHVQVTSLTRVQVERVAWTCPRPFFARLLSPSCPHPRTSQSFDSRLCNGW